MNEGCVHVGDLFIQRMRLSRDVESEKYYGPYCEPGGESWTVNCRNPRRPPRTALPLNFATYADAQRAMLALVETGLCTHAALHDRIKVRHDWAGVRRVMIEALNW